MEVLSLAVGLMSLVLGGFSIWLALQFYTKGKDAEKEAAKSLEGIRAQTDALQRLAGRWMDRMTRYVTEPRPADENMIALVSAVAGLPTAILSQIHLPQGAASNAKEPQANPALIADLVSCYISLYWYTAVANLAAQALLPDRDEFDPADANHTFLQSFVDASASDFRYMEVVISKVDDAWLTASPYQRMLHEAYGFRGTVRSAGEAFAAGDEGDGE